MDDTLYETKVGKMLQKVFGIEELETSHKVEKIHDVRGKCARASQFTSKVIGGETIARAAKRLPLLSIIALGVLELPKIFKATSEGNNILEQTKNTAKQTLKSGVNVASTFAGIGVFGALGSKYGGATGSLVGMGVGAVFGSLTSKKLQEVIG